MDKAILNKFKEMDNDERKKLIQVLQERTSKKEDKMDWMYKEHNIDNEDYLLGRKIDKAFVNDMNEKPEISSDAPGALFTEVIARRSQLDMQLKMKEDPLYVIRQQEMDAKRRVLENPLKLQKLKAILETQNEKSKKKKKKRLHSSSDDDEETKELLKKYLEIKKMKESSKSAEVKVDEQRSRHKREGRDEDTIKVDRIASPDHSSDEDRSRKHHKYGLEVKSHHSNSINHKKVDYSNISAKKPIQELPKKVRLTESEKEEMRKRMMSNAKETELERQRNIKKHTEDLRKEKEQIHSNNNFLDPMIMNMASNSSVEDRIKRNRHTVQKSRDDYHKSFAKK